MKRKLKGYIPYYPTFESISTAQKALDENCLMVWEEKPNTPYLEVEVKVIYHERYYSHNRTSFADKIESQSIIVPKKFAGKD